MRFFTLALISAQILTANPNAAQEIDGTYFEIFPENRDDDIQERSHLEDEQIEAFRTPVDMWCAVAGRHTVQFTFRNPTNQDYVCQPYCGVLVRLSNGQTAEGFVGCRGVASRNTNSESLFCSSSDNTVTVLGVRAGRKRCNPI